MAEAAGSSYRDAKGFSCVAPLAAPAWLADNIRVSVSGTKKNLIQLFCEQNGESKESEARKVGGKPGKRRRVSFVKLFPPCRVAPARTACPSIYPCTAT